jgi:flagellar M-ring protein FliF
MGNVVSTAELKKKQFEDDTTKKVLAVLAHVVGKENVVVSVAAMLNFDQQEAKIHRVIPSGGDENKPVGVAVSQQNQSETYSGEKKPGAGGEAGATNNLPSYSSADGSGEKKDNSDYEFGKTTTNYEVSREDKTIVYAPGQIERLTVAVVMNKVLTAQETEEIKELVANAAGLDVSRGDSVYIKGFQFTQLVGADAEKLSASAKEAHTKAFWLKLATVLGVSVVLLVALFLFYNLVKAPASKGQIIHVPQKLDLPEPVIIDPTQFDDPALPPPPPMPIIEAQMDPETEAMRDAIGTAIETDPSEAARLLVAYMRDY